jgi:glycosyltransferase involved in cell wall biosynthesis
LLVNRNLEPIYNVKMALQAFEKVKQSHPNSRLDIVGSGQQEEALKTWVKERNLEDVFFHGAVPNKEIPFHLEQADILLNPSDVDNMPINLLEAFASGVPVVSTRVGGIPDLVGEERAAMLVEPGNHQQMAEKIEELVTHPEKVEQLTTYAKDLCDGFGWISVRDRLLEVYYPQGTTASRLQT